MVKVIGILGITVLLVINGATTTTASASVGWSVNMTAASNSEGTNPNLAFGTNNNATDGYDTGIDVPHPPPAPGAMLDAYFSINHPLFHQIDEDYRAPAESNQWILYLQSSSQDIILTWDANNVPDDMSLQMSDAGLDIDMKPIDRASLVAGAHTLTITATRIVAVSPMPHVTPSVPAETVVTPTATGNATPHLALPVLTITSPEDGLTTGNTSLAITCTIDDKTITEATLILNGGTPQTIAVREGSFSHTITLAEGLNTISILATNAAGKVGISRVTVEMIPVLTGNLTEKSGPASMNDQAAPSAEQGTSTTTQVNPINWPALYSVIGGVVLVIVLIFLLVGRHH